MTLHSSISEKARRNFFGFAIAPRCKLDFCHSSLRCSADVCSLASPSCSDDDAANTRVFLCFNCRRPQKQRWQLGFHISKGWTCKVTNRFSLGLQCFTAPLTSNGIYFCNFWSRLAIQACFPTQDSATKNQSSSHPT